MSIKVEQFTGMNDVVNKSKGGLELPSVILNSHVKPDGSVEKRQGMEKIVDMPNVHSLWTNNKGVVLFRAGNKLYRLLNKTTPLELDILTTTPELDKCCYLEVSGYIYISSTNYIVRLEIATNIIETWGIPIPSSPILNIVAGGMPKGIYHVCLTNVRNGRISGNSVITPITLIEDGGIEITNLPADAQVWITEPNGSQFFFAGTNPQIVTLPQTQETLQTLWAKEPPVLKNLCWNFGRVWGSIGNRIVYSEPYQPELFGIDDFFELEEEPLLIAKTTGGMFIGCKSKTFYLAGNNPMEMHLIESDGGGVLEGSLSYITDMGEYGKNVPLWMSSDGVCVGLHTGQVLNITKDKIKIDLKNCKGSSICRVADGTVKALFSISGVGGASVGFGDSTTAEVVRNGKVI